MRNNGEDDFIFRVILGRLAKEVFQYRNLGQAGDSAELLGLLIFHNAAQQVGLAVLQTDFMFDLALSNDGLADAADVLLAGDGGNVHRDLQSDFAAGVNRPTVPEKVTGIAAPEKVCVATGPSSTGS